MFADIKMNRSVSGDKDNFSPGGYEMVMNGKNIRFDFQDYQSWVDEVDPSIVHIQGKNPDDKEFECLTDITIEDLNNVTAIQEFFIFTGEAGETDLKPVELLACSFVLTDDNGRHIVISERVVKHAVVTSNIL